VGFRLLYLSQRQPVGCLGWAGRVGSVPICASRAEGDARPGDAAQEEPGAVCGLLKVLVKSTNGAKL
jgi:hypothetical protein